MANQKQVQLLKISVNEWNAWRGQNPDEDIDLEEANLKGANLKGADLEEAKLKGADLQGADLQGTNLYGANLREALLKRANLQYSNLQGANLIFADLEEAKLKGADLQGTNLHGANLLNANLQQTDLRDANLKSADLRSAKLIRAYLRWADFSNTLFGSTIFSEVNLSEAINLNTSNHIGSSSIGQETLFKSASLPEEFLRGCGLADWQIESTKLSKKDLTPKEITDIGYNIINAHIQSPIQYYSCFISYSHADKDFARKLHDSLQDKGIRVWLDEQQMLPGDDIYQRIDHGIKHWDKLLLCCSRHSLTSWWVDNEIDITFNKERVLFRERGKKVYSLIPLNLDGYMFSDEWQSGKKRAILSRIAADFSEEKNFDNQLELLIKALTTDDMGRIPPPEQKL